jgi:hypothetical protein
MVERAYLSKTIIDGAKAPRRGERWISDTDIRGFGLRIWRSPNGKTGKAFAIRVQDVEGKTRRQSLSYWECQRLHERAHSYEYWKKPWLRPALGEMAAIGRSWARDTIDRLQGRPTLQEELEAERERVRVRVAGYTFSKAAEIVIAETGKSSASKAYCDRLDKLFFQHVPVKLRQKSLRAVTETAIVRVLGSKKLTTGNLRVLRPLLRRCFELADRCGVETRFHAYDMRDLNLSERSGTSGSVAGKWRKEDVERFQANLLSEDTCWQQAACLALYLESSAPLSRILAATTNDVWRVRYKLHDGTLNEIFELRVREGWRGIIQLKGFADRALRVSEAKRRSTHPNSKYLFPSPLRPDECSITSCDVLWDAVCKSFSLGPVSVRVFRRDWHKLKVRFWAWDEDV